MRSKMVEGATATPLALTPVIFCTAARPLHRASRGPPPPLRCATRGRTSAIVLAARFLFAPEFFRHEANKPEPDLRQTTPVVEPAAVKITLSQLVTTGLDPVVHAEAAPSYRSKGICGWAP